MLVRTVITISKLTHVIGRMVSPAGHLFPGLIWVCLLSVVDVVVGEHVSVPTCWGCCVVCSLVEVFLVAHVVSSVVVAIREATIG